MWLPLALLAAFGSASVGLALKRAVTHGGAVVSTVAFRIVAGVLLSAGIMCWGEWPATTPAYWRTAALVLPPEVGGMLCMSLALRAGDLSLVQPIFGLIPLLVMLGGAIFLGEVPSAPGAVGILLVAAGVYCVGAQGGGSLLAPLRALVRSRASWFAVAASLFWSVATVLHKVGIAEVGPLPWAVTLAFGSALLLGVALPVMAWRTGGIGLPRHDRTWIAAVALAGLLYAVQQTGLQIALGRAQASYVMAVSSTSTVLATAFGVLLLGERAAARGRILGAVLVSAGAALIALGG